MSKKKPEQKIVNLALQGGGAHGAYAWGVLDKLLEDGRIDIDGICATSAGAMNGCALAYGHLKGGKEGARQVLHDFWKNVSTSAQQYKPMPKMPWQNFMDAWGVNTSSHHMFDAFTRILSPYQYNPFDINPLRDVLDKTIDFNALKKCQCTKLFISATHVHSGKVRVFETHEITQDVVMASACLPYVFKAVGVNGEDYWDGGYLGNPALFPLFYKTDTRDVIIVHINPMERNETPTNAADIMNRINEISFNSSLLQEMRAIAFVKKLIENDMLRDEHKDQFKNILVHSVRSDEAMRDLSATSKFDTDWEFLKMLRDKGRDTMATRWRHGWRLILMILGCVIRLILTRNS